MKKNYYKILNIDHDEDAKGIRTAYLKMVKIHHPDRAGRKGTSAFQDVSEAYQVLSDPEKRRCYDRSFPPEKKQGSWNPNKPEPLIPSCYPRPRSRGPSFEDVFESVWMGSDRLENHYDADVLLTQEEAEQGCFLNFGISIPNACIACWGTGMLWPFRCCHCHGAGYINEDLHFRFRIPPMVRNGTAFELPLHNDSNSLLRIHVSIC